MKKTFNAIKIDRTRYDKKNKTTLAFRVTPGINRRVVTEISKRKNEPDWLLGKRLESLKIFEKLTMPKWTPDISGLDLDKITYFTDAGNKEARKWEDVPVEIRKTFERLGIPEAERTVLAGAGAQYESQMAYHKLKEEWEKQGVIFENFDVAVRKHEKLIREYFMTKCVPSRYHKFAALHGAVFSGGTFIYVPKGVKVKAPLQAYFRMNAVALGQFEHTLIIVDEGADLHYIEGCSAPRYDKASLHAGCVEIFVRKGARMRYSSIENWSKNTYNLNTKKALVEEDGIMEWVSGNLGSGLTMLYPCSVLSGKGAKTDFLTIAFAGKDQNQDTGTKVLHLAPNTSSTTVSKSIAKNGGTATYRGLVKIVKGAKNSKSKTVCDSLLFDGRSNANTYPSIDVEGMHADLAHEASVGRVGEEQLFYLRSRGISETESVRLIVSGFIEPIVKKLPFEYAVELNRLIDLEMEGSVG
jgi:Fe-S cluster assembly protein SufB